MYWFNHANKFEEHWESLIQDPINIEHFSPAPTKLETEIKLKKNLNFLYNDSNVPILKLQKTTSMKEDPTHSQQATQAEPKLCASQNQPFVSIFLSSKARSLLADLSRTCLIKVL